MGPQNVTYHNSPHARVPCVECHIGPGTGFWVRSKIDGVRQVVATATDSFERPIPTPVVSLRPAQETCEECHWPAQFFGQKLITHNYYQTDENSYAVVGEPLGQHRWGQLPTGGPRGHSFPHVYRQHHRVHRSRRRATGHPLVPVHPRRMGLSGSTPTRTPSIRIPQMKTPRCGPSTALIVTTGPAMTTRRRRFRSTWHWPRESFPRISRSSARWESICSTPNMRPRNRRTSNRHQSAGLLRHRVLRRCR